ncbi:RAQPRD family integrative conjugative element protein [Vibrio mediterranei]|uniref:RAQPRD family integrative conjugative element protein n=1 Tax=Vibrio mediterranei TaxID=689 RepID=UPI0040685D83
MSIKSLLVLVSVTLVSLSTQAGVWEEREYLERYQNQLTLLTETVLKEAELSADPHARIRMNYGELKRDLNDIQIKLSHYLNDPMRQIVLEGLDESH